LAGMRLYANAQRGAADGCHALHRLSDDVSPSLRGSTSIRAAGHPSDSIGRRLEQPARRLSEYVWTRVQGMLPMAKPSDNGHHQQHNLSAYEPPQRQEEENDVYGLWNMEAQAAQNTALSRNTMITIRFQVRRHLPCAAPTLCPTRIPACNMGPVDPAWSGRPPPPAARSLVGPL
jgi:hypothetical protein